jgi:hypothetical protein
MAAPITPLEIIQIVKTAISNGNQSFVEIYSELIEAYNETPDDDSDKEILGSLLELLSLLATVIDRQ